jgi:hypothetical protein
MSDHINNYRDPNLSLYQLNGDYTLLLQIYPVTFSYAITYQDKLQAWANDCDLLVLDDPGTEHELLNFEYKKVVSGLQSTGFTLVPNELYSEDKITEMARLLDVRSNEKIFAQSLDNDNYIIYKVDERVVATAAIYGLRNTVFINKGWITAVSRDYPALDSLYINIDKKQADILYFTFGRIRFYNSFGFNNPDELAYYTAFVAKELQLQPKDLTLVLSGEVDSGDENFSRLAEFFGSVRKSNLENLNLPSAIPSHQIVALAALSLCVSSEED